MAEQLHTSVRSLERSAGTGLWIVFSDGRVWVWWMWEGDEWTLPAGRVWVSLVPMKFSRSRVQRHFPQPYTLDFVSRLSCSTMTAHGSRVWKISSGWGLGSRIQSVGRSGVHILSAKGLYKEPKATVCKKTTWSKTAKEVWRDAYTIYTLVLVYFRFFSVVVVCLVS